jgi:chitin disaccharide deacetylase
MKSLRERLGFSRNDIIVIVNIDDVGLHRDETKASLAAIEAGMVKSGSIMIPCPNADQVIAWWKKHSDADLGIHLTLTCEWGPSYPWKPVLPEAIVPSLYNGQGLMWASVEELWKHAALSDIRRELEAQIESVIDRGMIPTHIDHHMDFYYHSELFELVMEISRKYDLPMRVWRRRRYAFPFVKHNLITLRRSGYVFPDTQMGIYNLKLGEGGIESRKMLYYTHLRFLKPGVHNIKVHTALNTPELSSIMGEHHAAVRQNDFDVWSSAETRKLAEDLGIIFIGFRPLQKLQRRLMKQRVC